jgi:hypothetical protein
MHISIILPYELDYVGQDTPLRMMSWGRNDV